MAITLAAAEVIAIAPELAGKETLIGTLIADAIIDFQGAPWASETRAKRALKWLVAHQTVLVSRGSNGAGRLQSIRVGDVAKTFAADARGDGEFAATPYGEQYLRLLRSEHGGPVVF